MANEFVSILSKRDRSGITNAQYQVFTDTGNLFTELPAVEIPGEAVYRADMPSGTAAGRFPFRLQRADNFQVLAFGEVFWNGTDAVTESEYAQLQLNDITAQQVAVEVADQIAQAQLATATALQDALFEILTQVSSTQGLPDTQLAMLTFIRDVIEADEVLTPLSAQKLLKGTSTVLVNKDVTSTTTCNVNTQLTEAV